MEQAFRPDPQNPPLFDYFNYLIDIVYLVDVIMMFFTSVLTRTGKESFDSGVIARSYTSTKSFWVDFLSLFGNGIFVKINRLFKPFGYFKMLRVFRLG